MSKPKIHFRNTPFMARVPEMGEGSVQCTPIVYDEMTSCGVGVSFENGQGQVWGLITPRNLIAAWRGTEVLRRLDSIEHGTLCAAYNTGARNPSKWDLESYVNPTIARIGREAYDAIMSAPVPEEIIRAILDNQKDDFPPALYPITDEVRAGTIPWRQEFADTGIERPDEIDAKQRAQEETIKKYERLLASYAVSRDLHRKCMGMGHVESAVLVLIEKGANQNHSDKVLIALAGVVGQLASSEFAMSIIPFGPRNREEFMAQVERTKETALDNSAAWLASPLSFTTLMFWKRDRTTYSNAEAKKLLRGLLETYFPTKPEPVTV